MIALLHKISVFVSGEKEVRFNLEDRWFPRCLAVDTQGRVSPFRVTFVICSEVLFLEKKRHFVLLLAGTGSVLNNMECEVENSSQIFNII